MKKHSSVTSCDCKWNLINAYGIEEEEEKNKKNKKKKNKNNKVNREKSAFWLSVQK